MKIVKPPHAGKRLRYMREKHNLSVFQLARILGVSAAELHNFENEKKMLRAETIAVCAHIFDVPLKWFYEGVS
ncbi:MAG: helix-turn-helix transcriptional regulator [Alphaproteobacteria bacterium]|nr:helix-turn-helix transcriptional regulator [Alphaproteobacteria bacterium]MDD9920011.1 helix-turn-helix transcriptional regulator [Alphaproteobacteria bacterium]